MTAPAQTPNLRSVDEIQQAAFEEYSDRSRHQLDPATGDRLARIAGPELAAQTADDEPLGAA
jgi:hypothetical protein